MIRPLTILLIIGLICLLWLVGERGQLLLPSTRRFFKDAGQHRFWPGDVLHGYLYLRLQKLYVNLILKVLDPIATQGLRNWLAGRYHGKVLTRQQARELIAVRQPIPLQDLEQVVPYPAARQIVLQAPPVITAYQCPCRSAREHPCQPTQVCLFIGEPFASFMLEHHPDEARKLTREEALDLLEAEHQRGHIHTAWFKDVMLDRFYVLCNCCKCCCGGIEMMQRYGTPTMSASGYIAEVDAVLCAACGACEQVCAFSAISAGKVNWASCLGCGLCVPACPSKAVTLVRDERKGIPLEVKLLADAQRQPQKVS